jgi:hypothetical protein
MLEMVATQVLAALMAKHPATDEHALCEQAVAIAKTLRAACAAANGQIEQEPTATE